MTLPTAADSSAPASPSRPDLPRETDAALQAMAAAQTRRGRRTMGVILALCTLPVIASYLTYFYFRPAARTNYATLIEPQRPLPDLVALPAQDLAGHSVPLTTLKGQWLIVVVAPAECDHDCEQHLFMQRQLREMNGAESARIDKVWLVDSPGPLRPAIAAAVAQSPPVRVYRVDRAALARWLEPAPGQSLEDHLYVVDPFGNWMMRTPARLDPVRFQKDLARLLQASAWWDRPARDGS